MFKRKRAVKHRYKITFLNASGLNDGSNVKEFKLNFGEDEETHLLSPEGKDIATSPRGGLEGVIYDLSGRKINCQLSPANSQLPKGLYIVNGKKIIK